MSEQVVWVSQEIFYEIKVNISERIQAFYSFICISRDTPVTLIKEKS